MKHTFRLRLLLLLALMAAGIAIVSAQNAAQVLDKAVTKVRKASSVNCGFRIESKGSAALSGTFESSAGKFRLKTPAGTTWYDGRDMWTSNPRTKEITVVKPSDAEVSEVNPFAYLDSWKSKYVVGFSRRKDAARHLVVINPKDRNSDIKAVEIAVNKKTYLPERFIIRDRNDNVSTVYINTLTLTAKNAASLFECPVGSMSDYEVVDLR